MRSQTIAIALFALLTLGCESGTIVDPYEGNLLAYTSAPSYAIEFETVPYDEEMGGSGSVYRTTIVTRIVNNSPGSVATSLCDASDSVPAHSIRRDDGHIGLFSANRPCLGLSGPTIPSGGERVDTLVFADTFYCCRVSSFVSRVYNGPHRISFLMGDVVLQTNRFMLKVNETP